MKEGWGEERVVDKPTVILMHTDFLVLCDELPPRVSCYRASPPEAL